MLARHASCLERGIAPVVPTGALAEAWRGGAMQTGLARLLDGCQVEALDAERARAVGVLAGLSSIFDVVDVSVVEAAVRHRAVIMTSNPSAIEQVVRAAEVALRVEQV
jgi:hypothetical protein